MNDLVIIGAGPAGLTASIYASCYKIPYLLIGKVIGGQMSLATHILNYPGLHGITGKELTEKMVGQVRTLGAEIVTESVIKVSKFQSFKEAKDTYDYFEIETESGKKYQARSVILATGMERRKLGVPGETEYTGRGVFYCATCEKKYYEGKTVGIIGGGNSALQAAVQLSDFAKKVYIIYRGTELRGDQVWMEQIKNNPKIEVVYQTVISEIIGDGKWVTGAKIKQLNNVAMLQLDAVFVEIGGVPGSALAIGLGVEIDEKGLIKVHDDLSTNISGVFAAGDLVGSRLSLEQISTAVGLGARATASAYLFLKGQKAPTVWGESRIKR